MKYTIEQKQTLRDSQKLNFRTFRKDKSQEKLQEIIDNHYPEPEKYETFESKINQ